MISIILNETNEFVIEEYTRHTTFQGENADSVITLDFGAVNAEKRNIYNIGAATITSIQVKLDNEVIDTLSNINAKIDSITEEIVTGFVRLMVRIKIYLA